VEKIADSLRIEFTTKNGRKVYDGGGLDPDVIVKSEYLGAITIGLLSKGLMFEYATSYCNVNSPPQDFKSFHLNDSEYNNFVSWVKSQKFSYSTSLEESSAELYTAAQSERYFNVLENPLNGLRSTIKANKENDFLRFKVEIKEILERQISFHYATNKGEVEYSIDKDESIIEACRILDSSSVYNKILTPTR